MTKINRMLLAQPEGGAQGLRERGGGGALVSGMSGRRNIFLEKLLWPRLDGTCESGAPRPAFTASPLFQP